MVSKLCSNGCQTENNKIIGRSLEERGQRQSHRHRLNKRTKNQEDPPKQEQKRCYKTPPFLAVCRGCIAKVKKWNFFALRRAET